MGAYIIRRLLLIIPTLLLIMLVNFLVVQAAPGGPVEQMIANLTGQGADITTRVTQGGAGENMQAGNKPVTGGGGASKYRGAQGLDPEFIADLEKQFGFDKPLHKRFFSMLKNYLSFDFGDSFFQDRSVIELVRDKMPVSISLGLWTTLLVYLISIPLGILKAMRDGSAFDVWSSVVIIIGTAIPSFLFAVFLLLLFSGGSYLDWFPLGGLTSENWAELSWPARSTGVACPRAKDTGGDAWLGPEVSAAPNAASRSPSSPSRPHNHGSMDLQSFERRHRRMRLSALAAWIFAGRATPTRGEVVGGFATFRIGSVPHTTRWIARKLSQ